jgi:hypothetical protein
MTAHTDAIFGRIGPANDIALERTDLPMVPHLPAGGVVVRYDDCREGGALLFEDTFTGQRTRYVYVGMDLFGRRIPVRYGDATPEQRELYVRSIEAGRFGEPPRAFWQQRPQNSRGSRATRRQEPAPLHILPTNIMEFPG